jgi:hypothetical protein
MNQAAAEPSGDFIIRLNGFGLFSVSIFKRRNDGSLKSEGSLPLLLTIITEQLLLSNSLRKVSGLHMAAERLKFER